jgi:hypothetical protein
MPATVHRHLNGFSDMVAALRALQTYLGRPVLGTSDPQSIKDAILGEMRYLSTQVAAGQPSGFKWDPANVRKALVDHSIPGAIIALELAADLT